MTRKQKCFSPLHLFSSVSSLPPSSASLSSLPWSPSDVLPGWLLFLLLQLRHQHIDRSPSSSAVPLERRTVAANSSILTPLHPRLRGSEEKINNWAKWGGVRGQRGSWQVCQGKEGARDGGKVQVCVCVWVCECITKGVLKGNGVGRGLVGASVRPVRDQIYDHWSMLSVSQYIE